MKPRTAALNLDQAVALIALNDEPTCLRVEEVRGMCSVAIVADIFGITARGLARKVVKFRMEMCAKCEAVHGEGVRCDP